MTFLFSLFIFVYSEIAHSSNVPIDFVYEGKKHHLEGEKISGGYHFNKGAAKSVNLVTLDWPPYIAEDICKQGWIFQVTVALLVSQNYEVTLLFRPWMRAVMEVETGMSDILFPEYFIEKSAPSDIDHNTKRVDHLALSDPIPGGPIAFMKRAGDSDRYKGNLQNLKQESIGVVRGYQNTPEFDALMDADFFKILEVTDDMQNIKILIARRVNLIIGDPSVMKFSIQSSNMEKQEKENILKKLEVVSPSIQENYLYYAISKANPQWKQILTDINKAILLFTETGELDNIIRRTKQRCGYN